ncbi:unnamed protein product [Brachionus calyciflorus]|uniref:Uncharacterized protein n=1 Tax=Brachionus calyciflorus TaxID=104777 RepID=A0A813U5F2_9BILA|nr:unnamed protein product [Brachionus calyciflorus]
MNEMYQKDYGGDSNQFNFDNTAKKKEIFNYIDNYSQPNLDVNHNQNMTIRNQRSFNSLNSKNSLQNSNSVEPERYWNDWFGRPGAGAPKWTAYKQNLDKMLEPNSNDVFYYNKPYVPTVASQVKSPRKPRSNHHNNYEMIFN